MGFPGGSEVRKPPANAADAKAPETGSVPVLGRSTREEMSTHSSILAWRIPQTEESGGL